MRSRWISTFTVIGVLLLVLGIVGWHMGSKFVFDPGQTPDPREPYYYMLLGVLMILNGVFTPVNPEDDEDATPAPKARAPGGARKR